MENCNVGSLCVSPFKDPWHLHAKENKSKINSDDDQLMLPAQQNISESSCNDPSEQVLSTNTFSLDWQKTVDFRPEWAGFRLGLETGIAVSLPDQDMTRLLAPPSRAEPTLLEREREKAMRTGNNLHFCPGKFRWPVTTSLKAPERNSARTSAV